jgi:predicted RNA binding protein YcfA (HicA-like mRNA interferase family)
MSNYPSVTGKRLLKALLRRKYIVVKRKSGKRGKASHVVIRHPIDKTRVTVIVNTTEDLKKGTLGAIRRQLKLPKKDFIEILRDC